MKLHTIVIGAGLIAIVVLFAFHITPKDELYVHYLRNSEFYFSEIHKKYAWRNERRLFNIENPFFPVKGHFAVEGEGIVIIIRDKINRLQRPWESHPYNFYEYTTIYIPHDITSGNYKYDISNDNVIVFYSYGNVNVPLRSTCSGYGMSGSIAIYVGSDDIWMMDINAEIYTKWRMVPGLDTPSEECPFDDIRNRTVKMSTKVTEVDYDWAPPWENKKYWLTAREEMQALWKSGKHNIETSHMSPTWDN